MLETLTVQLAENATADVLAKGHCAAAYAYWQDWWTTDEESRAYIDAEARRFGRPVGLSPYASLIFATVHANYSVRLGLVSAAIFNVGFGVEDVVEQLGADVGRASPRFMPLWNALAKREDEVLAQERRRQGRVAREPNAYICAAEGCQVEGLHRTALRACSGKCPPDLKPHYCGRECQRRVRRRSLSDTADHALTSSLAGLVEPQGGLQAGQGWEASEAALRQAGERRLPEGVPAAE